MTKYAENVLAEMREIGSFNYETAKVFAEKHNLPVRSVIAKVRSMELGYTPKAPGEKSAKTATKAPRKSTIVASINAKLGLQLASLEKMTVADLQALEAALS